MLIRPLRIPQILRLDLGAADNAPAEGGAATSELRRGICFRAKLAQRVALAGPRRRLSKGVERGVLATSDSGGHRRRHVAREAGGSSNGVLAIRRGPELETGASGTLKEAVSPSMARA